MTTVTVRREEKSGVQHVVWAVASGAGLTAAALASYELTTRILTTAVSSRDDQMLGGMWSVVATMFVCRQSYNESLGAALSRTAATSLSFILCLGYLLLFPFSCWGMAILIGIGGVILIMIDRPGGRYYYLNYNRCRHGCSWNQSPACVESAHPAAN